MNTPAVLPTSRENEVLALLTRGYENQDIARALGISHRTVKQHMARLFVKYGIYTPVKRVKLILAVLPELEQSTITIPHLTPKELQIIRLVSTGASNEDVGVVLNTSTQVIKNHLRAVYDKTGSSTRSELCLWVMRTGIRHSLASDLQERVETPEYARVIA